MRWAVALAGGLWTAGATLAQQTELEPSAAVQCLTPAAAERGVPEFPFAAFKQGLTGRVKVQLRFTGPALAPAVTVLSQEGDPSFEAAVREHVRTLRVPCHDGAGPVDLVFDFIFDPNQSSVAPGPEDAREAERHAQLRCLEHIGGINLPEYPPEALRRAVQGRVLTELRFEAPDRPPVARILPRVGGDGARQARHDTQVFVEPLRRWVAGYRLPCLQGQPVTLSQTYVYMIEGSDFGFKPGLGLRELLARVRGIRQQRLRFDLSSMGCPFELSLTYRQPNLPNIVRELGASDPTRRPLLTWLAQVEFDLPAASLDAVYGDVLKFSVPCLKIDLNPKE